MMPVVLLRIVSKLDRILALEPFPTQPFITLLIPVAQVPRQLADLASVFPSSFGPEESLEPQCPLAGRHELEDGIPFPSGVWDAVPVAAGDGEACHLGASIVVVVGGVEVRMAGRIWEGRVTSFGGGGHVARCTVQS